VAQGRYAEAEPLYQRSLAIDEKALGPDHPSVATSLNNLAELHKAQGRYVDAEPLYKRSLAIKEKAPGPDPSSFDMPQQPSRAVQPSGPLRRCQTALLGYRFAPGNKNDLLWGPLTPHTPNEDSKSKTVVTLLPPHQPVLRRHRRLEHHRQRYPSLLIHHLRQLHHQQERHLVGRHYLMHYQAHHL
jgi:tetratricopeptide (TPR) repeat protein